MKLLILITIKIGVFCTLFFPICSKGQNPKNRIQITVGNMEILHGQPALVNPFQSVQGAPIPSAFALEKIPNLKDLSSQYRENQIKFVRIPQDDGFGSQGYSLASVFPQSDADTENPSSYHFEAIDALIGSVSATGASVLWQAIYDIGGGDKWSGCCQAGRPPRDLLKWKKVIKGALKHFNRGWANGTKDQIKYVEFINEPCGLGGFQCYRKNLLGQVVLDPVGIAQLQATLRTFFEAIAEYNLENSDQIKSVCCSYPLGPQTGVDSLAPLVNYLKKEGFNLDVFSYHQYGNADTLVKTAAQARNLLTHSGYSSDFPIWLTEWNFLSTEGMPKELNTKNAFLASHNAYLKVALQRILDEAFVYRVGPMSTPNLLKQYQDAGSALDDSFYINPKDSTLNPTAFHWKFLGDRVNGMLKEAPYRLNFKVVNPGTSSLQVLAGQDSEAQTIALAIVNWKPYGRFLSSNQTEAYQVELSGIARGEYELSLYEISPKFQSLLPKSVATAKVDSSGSLIVPQLIPQWSTHYLTIKRK